MPTKTKQAVEPRTSAEKAAVLAPLVDKAEAVIVSALRAKTAEDCFQQCDAEARAAALMVGSIEVALFLDRLRKHILETMPKRVA